MSEATIIDGKAFAQKARDGVASKVAKLKAEHGIIPGLAVVLVGEDPASQVYVRNKGKSTVEASMESFEFRMPDTSTHDEVLAKVEELNADPRVNGILVQLPLPKHISAEAVAEAIDPAKDADALHPLNFGRLLLGNAKLISCTPLGVMAVLKHHGLSLIHI